MSYELRNRPRSLLSLHGSVIEHQIVESKGLRFDFSWGLRIFSLSYAHDKKKKHLSMFLYQVQTYKHYAINIADPSSMQDVCHMNFVIDLVQL